MNHCRPRLEISTNVYVLVKVLSLPIVKDLEMLEATYKDRRMSMILQSCILDDRFGEIWVSEEISFIRT